MSISYIKEKIKGLIETEEVFHYLVVIAVFLAVLATFGIWKLVTYSKPSPINIEAPSSFDVGTTTSKDNIVASKNGAKYYLSTCSGVKRIKEENKVFFNSETDAINAGYTKASNCK